MKLTQAQRSRRFLASPRGQYYKHRHNAKDRGVEFKLTFTEWFDIWQNSGHWKQRGNRKGKYCMARNDDKGAYEVGNVRITTWSKNIIERNHIYHSEKETAT